jgi:biotin operon repressor
MVPRPEELPKNTALGHASVPSQRPFSVRAHARHSPTKETTVKPRVRKVAVIVGASALLGAAGCGATTQTSTSAAGTSAAARTGGPDVSALAAKLGVSTSALQKAMQATRPSQPSSGSQSQAQDRAAALAKELGISEAKVRAAMQSLGPPSGQSQGNGSAPAAPPSGTTTGSAA